MNIVHNKLLPVSQKPARNQSNENRDDYRGMSVVAVVGWGFYRLLYKLFLFVANGIIIGVGGC